jgi:hypothetical protein
MTVPALPYSFVDGGFAGAILGPRKEVTLELVVWNRANPEGFTVYIRFGGISNYEEVQGYIKRIPPPPFEDALYRIEYLDYDTQEMPHAHELFFKLALEYCGSVTINCRNVSVREADQPEFVRLG